MAPLYTFYLTYPLSITYPTLGTVKDVSAMLVANMIFLQLGGVCMNALACCSGVYAPYSGTIIMGGTGFFADSSSSFW